MGSLTVSGVRFVVYPNDHRPRHVQEFSAGTEVVVDFETGGVSIADRNDAIQPRNAKRTDFLKILNGAAKHYDQLVALRKKYHG